jgi:thiamine-monophosphate kinase
VALSEFDLIRDYFAAATTARDDVSLGIGDDCALLRVPAGRELAVSMDTLVEGRHFSAGADPEALGHKALAVNLSDLAAMGAEPAWFTLALTLPRVDASWLRGFTSGLSALAATHGVQLVGGDTTRGPLSITIQVHGFVEPGRALRRAGGRAGDRLFVSGTLGDAALALQQRLAGGTPGDGPARRLDRPNPRCALGRLLLDHASAAIDISDGLVGDLGHVCKASGTGARVELASLPLSPPVAAVCRQEGWRLPLAGGDDYELLFSVPPARVAAMTAAAAAAGHRVQEIGSLAATPGIRLIYPDCRESEEIPDGFDHFRD